MADLRQGQAPGRVNLGDCFTYALALRRDATVLCTGRDFSRTDLDVVPYG